MMKAFQELQQQLTYQRPAYQSVKSFFTFHPLLNFLIVFSLLTFISNSSAQKTYKLSVVPQSPALVIYDAWQPLLDYLEEVVAVELEVSSQEIIPFFEVDYLY